MSDLREPSVCIIKTLDQAAQNASPINKALPRAQAL